MIIKLKRPVFDYPDDYTISLSFDSAEVTEEGNIILKNRKEGK